MGRLQITAKAASGGYGDRLEINAGTQTPDGGASIAGRTLQLVTSTDTASQAQVQPGAALAGATSPVVQRVGWRISVGGTDITQYLTASPVEVSRSISRAIQVGAFETTADLDGLQPLGSVWNQGAPITGLDEIDISLAYLSDDGSEAVEPLITAGMADTSQRTLSGTRTDTVSVVDKMARYAEVPVTLAIDAGAGGTRDAVIAQILALMGLSGISLGPIGGTVQKAIDIAQGDGLSLAQALAEVKGRQILIDRDGTPTSRSYAHEETRGPLKWQFTMADVVYGVNGARVGGIQIRPKPEAYTKVTTRGSKQVVRPSNCGLQSTTTSSTTTGPYQPERFAFVQNGAGTVSATGLAALPLIDRTLAETTTTVTEDCGTLVSITTETRRLTLVGSAREQRNADGTNSLYYTCYLRANAATEPGFAYDAERFLLADKSVETLTYDSSGFLSKRVVETYGFYNPKTHLQSRTSATQAWSTQVADAAYNHNGVEGVVQQVETFQLIERVTEEYRVSGGYVQQKTTTREAFGRTRGVTYYYADGEFGQASETFQEVESTIESYRFVGEALTEVTILERTITGEPRSTTETRSGSPPTAPRTRINANNADRFEHQEIKASCEAPALLSVRRARELREQYWELAETEQELQALCDRILLSGQSPEISWAIPANARIVEGDWVHLSGEMGMEVDVFVRDVRHTGGQRGPILTYLTGDVVPGGVVG